jgi:hypothetical protein
MMDIMRMREAVSADRVDVSDDQSEYVFRGKDGSVVAHAVFHEDFTASLLWNSRALRSTSWRNAFGDWSRQIELIQDRDTDRWGDSLSILEAAIHACGWRASWRGEILHSPGTNEKPVLDVYRCSDRVYWWADVGSGFGVKFAGYGDTPHDALVDVIRTMSHHERANVPPIARILEAYKAALTATCKERLHVQEVERWGR